MRNEGSRTSRSPAFSARGNSGACRSASPRRRWCRGRTPRPWSSWRSRFFANALIAGRRPRIADIGTGSGAILLALLHEIPDAFGVGTDLSLTALGTARGNAAALGLADRATFVACSYASALHGPFDLIVSNPPYIPAGEIPKLSIEVREHDPHLALDGGNDGYDAYRALIPQAAERLVPGGALIVEAGQGQAGDIQALMAAAALSIDRPPRADLAGIPRAVSARKMPP